MISICIKLIMRYVFSFLPIFLLSSLILHDFCLTVNMCLGLVVWCITFIVLSSAMSIFLWLNVTLRCFMIRHTTYKKWILIFASNVALYLKKKPGMTWNFFLIISLPIWNLVTSMKLLSNILDKAFWGWGI